MIYFTAAVNAAKAMRVEKPQKAEKANNLVIRQNAFKNTLNSFSYSFNSKNYQNTDMNGCGGLTVMIQACGAWEPGSTPGRGLFSDFRRDLVHLKYH